MAPQSPAKGASNIIKYCGPRPPGDSDNACRERLCRLVRDAGRFQELSPEKLYLVELAKGKDASLFCESHSTNPDNPFILWNSSHTPTLTYQGFNRDFGPFNLAVTHLFCAQVKVWLDTQAFREPDKYVAIVLDDSNLEFKLNTTFLVAIAAMVLLNMSPEQVLAQLRFSMMHRHVKGEPRKDLVFRQRHKFTDVSGSYSRYDLNLRECVQSFYAALQNNFYQFHQFDQIEYLFYETVISGDFNWVVPGKLLAFAGPQDDNSPNSDYQKHPPELYFPYFKKHYVTTIVRLNEPDYDKSSFVRVGFQHFDLYFPDGSSPTMDIAHKFGKIVDEARGAVAVHCYAGIGRTGTLIAAYLMLRYNFDPGMAIAWTRICRPGSVIGVQQEWLHTYYKEIQNLRLIQKPLSATEPSPPTTPISTRNNKRVPKTNSVHGHDDDNGELESPVITPNHHLEESQTLQHRTGSTVYSDAEKTLGQAKALLLAKKQREVTAASTEEVHSTNNTPGRVCTRNAISLKNPTADKRVADSNSSNTTTIKKQQDTTTMTGTQASSIVLDLGKTLPLRLYLSDLMQVKKNENPKFYRLKDYKYEWKVKFPKPDYVTLFHFRKQDEQAAKSLNIQPERINREPRLCFGYEKRSGDSGATAAGDKLKPVVCYYLFEMNDT